MTPGDVGPSVQSGHRKIHDCAAVVPHLFIHRWQSKVSVAVAF